ncbi:MAG: AraC family transcriptional regulator [Myxococcota bacterium]
MGGSDTSLARQSAAFVWRDRALFIGDRSETATHAHHATELSVALDTEGIDIGVPGGPDFRGVPGAMVLAGAEHRLSIPGPKVAVLYIDAQSATASSLHQWLGDQRIRPLADDAVLQVRAQLLRVLRDRSIDLEGAEQICDQLLAQFAAPVAKPAMDHRVQRVMARIDVELDAPPTLHQLADELGLSSSRLRHMFVEQVGLPMTRYVLWMRLRAALVDALDGATMTASAQAAGFADAAHFTRTCRQMFGLPPSAFTPVDLVLVE